MYLITLGYFADFHVGGGSIPGQTTWRLLCSSGFRLRLVEKYLHRSYQTVRGRHQLAPQLTQEQPWPGPSENSAAPSSSSRLEDWPNLDIQDR